MGSFNTSCMVTGVEVFQLGKAMILPYKLNHHNFKENTDINYKGPSKSFFEDAEEMFSPYLLPIEGEYNTYGGIENIVENKNTKAIEKHFKVDIETFVEIIFCSRDFGSTLSALTNEFVSSNVLKVLSNHSVTIKEKLLALGFEIIKEKDEEGKEREVYKHPNCSFTVIEEEEENYILYNEDGTTKNISSHFNYDLFKVAIEKDNFFLGVPQSKQEIVLELYGLSGAFVHPDIYKFLSTFEADKQIIENEKSILTNGLHSVYSKGFSEELNGLSVFLTNLTRSNRYLKRSKTTTEFYENENATFLLGLMNLILEEAKKL